ncbi:MAG TPA: glycosyltransferase [Syntrophales bacterium]|nr:glycosyltransferase [Syntrophales bacterium]HPQ43673.1 glycosyltransferase [Syntrophales bacterium]
MLRTIKFLKYLTKLGWNPSVLTLKASSYMMKDTTLGGEVPDSVRVYRVRQCGRRFMLLLAKAGLNHWIQFPDKEASWIVTAFPKALGIIQREKIPIIYTTSPPHSTHLVGYLCKLVTGVKWIADFRDLWCGNPFFVPDTGKEKLLHEKLEKKVVARADFVLANTPQALSYFTATYPLMAHKFICLPNGFDPEDFDHIQPNKVNNKMIFTYVGTYGGMRPMDYFFQALREFFDETPGAEQEIEVVFVGTHSMIVQRLAERLGLDTVIRFKGHVSHEEAIRSIRESDVLLSFQFEDHGGSTALPSKIFEYMKAGKRIFSQTCEGPSTEIVRNYKGGYVADPKDITQIKQILHQLYEDYSSGVFSDIEDRGIENFNRINQTKTLSAIMLRALTGQ